MFELHVIGAWVVARGFALRLRPCWIFASLKFFSFCRGAKFGEFRPTAPAQVVCWLQVRVWRWGEIVRISPRG
jgi:hypothetical protein